MRTRTRQIIGLSTLLWCFFCVGCFQETGQGSKDQGKLTVDCPAGDIDGWGYSYDVPDVRYDGYVTDWLYTYDDYAYDLYTHDDYGSDIYAPDQLDVKDAKDLEDVDVDDLDAKDVKDVDGDDADTTDVADLDAGDVSIELDLATPAKCVLTLEHVATVPGYSYAASIDLDSLGRPHITYSSNSGSFKGVYAHRLASGTWASYVGLFKAARLFVELETNDVPALIGYDGAFQTSLYRLSYDGFPLDNPLIISPQSDSRSLYDSIGLGGQSHVSLVSGGDTRLVRVDGEKLQGETVTPAPHTPELARLAVNGPRDRVALYYFGPSPSMGPMVSDGLMRQELGSSSLVAIIPFGGSALAPILDASGKGRDQLLYLQRDAETSLRVLRWYENEVKPDVHFELPTGPLCPLTKPEDGSTVCSETFERYNRSMHGLRGTGSTNHFVVGRDRVTNQVSYTDLVCYPCDPIGPGESCPPPRCEPRPVPGYVSSQTIETTVSLFETPPVDESSEPKMYDLWPSGFSTYHLRARRDANGLIHILVIAYVPSQPNSGGSSGVFYLRVDPTSCTAP